MYEWIDGVRDAKVKKPMPVLSYPSVQLLGVTVKELTGSADLQARGMKLVADRTDALAAVSFMDLSVEAECFGSEIVKSDDEIPTVVGRIIETPEDAKNLKGPSAQSCRAGICVEGVRKAKELITDRPVFAGVIGAFSLAGRLVDVTEAMVLCYEDPDMLKVVLDKCTQFLIAYIGEFKKAGADGVVIAEPLTGMLSPDLAEEFSEPYLKRIVDEVQDENFLVIYHNCGNGTVRMIDSILRTGSKAYHFGNAIDMRDMMPLIPPETVAMGNIDPAGQFLNGTPESVREETLKLLEDCGKYPNFVISSGCDIPPRSDWKNIDAFFGAVKEYYERG